MRSSNRHAAHRERRLLLTGGKLIVTTSAGSQVGITRVGDNKLRGRMRMMTTGRTYPVEFVRE